MGLPQSPTPPPKLYPQSLQIKLYQAFIFSIPILFSIILFLLFYLFYLKRRSSMSTSSSRLPRSSTQATTVTSLALMGLKGILEHKLPVVLFDADSTMKDSQCCVCLGEFEIKEELHQLPSCQHVFHKDCIHHWLRSSATCPLCRCPVVITAKNIYQEQQDNENININQQVVTAEQQGPTNGSTANCIPEQNMVPAEGSSGGRVTLPDSVVIDIQMDPAHLT